MGMKRKILIVGCNMMLSSLASALSKLDEDEYTLIAIGEHDTKVVDRKFDEPIMLKNFEPIGEVLLKPTNSHPFEKFIGKKVSKGKRGRNF